MPLEGLAMNLDFWKGKRCSLPATPDSKDRGFSLWLQSMGFEVTGYALAPPTHPSLFELCKVDGLVHSIIADIRDGKTG